MCHVGVVAYMDQNNIRSMNFKAAHSVWAKYTKQTPFSEADSLSDGQEIPFFWNPLFHYRLHDIPTSVPVLRQMNLIYTLPNFIPYIHFNNTLASMLGSTEWSPIFRLYNETFFKHLSSITCVLHTPPILLLILSS